MILADNASNLVADIYSFHLTLNILPHASIAGGDDAGTPLMV